MDLGIVDEERADEATDDAFGALVERLSRQSVTPGKHFDAYTDVPWDDPVYAIDPTDPRWELGPDDVLGRTAWYRAQPQPVRARLGLHLIVNNMKTGLQFESVLKRGLLEWAMQLPNRAPEFRYAYHEVIEETQHSLMFQEFVNRSGFDPAGIPRWMRPATRRVVQFGRRFPELFFVFVLGGEDPIDYAQRQWLRGERRERDLHPLLERIMRIHVTEEARHLSFARHYLKTRVPRLGPVKRAWLSFQAPMILASMSQLMLRPSGDVVRTYRIPKAVIEEAYTKNPEHAARTRASLAKVRRLCVEIGIVNPVSKRLWKAWGIWADD